MGKDALQPDANRLSARVKELRDERHLSQIGLAHLAGVSARSIKLLEGGTIPRYDALLRLASTFGESPKQWLQWAGLDASDEQVARVLRRQRSERTAAAFRPLSPAEYLDVLESRVTIKTPALMVVVILSRMAVRNDDVRARTRVLLGNGLRIALATPFPSDVFPPDIDPSLRGFYSQTYGHAHSYVRELQRIAPEGARQVRLFKPRHDRIMVVQPPALLNELRPCITTFFDEHRTAVGQQLTLYTRFTDGRPDRWTLVAPESGLGEDRLRAEEACAVWGGYTHQILNGWRIGQTPAEDSVQLRDDSDWEEVKFNT